jgi:hypothetical protein
VVKDKSISREPFGGYGGFYESGVEKNGAP